MKMYRIVRTGKVNNTEYYNSGDTWPNFRSNEAEAKLYTDYRKTKIAVKRMVNAGAKQEWKTYTSYGIKPADVDKLRIEELDLTISGILPAISD